MHGPVSKPFYLGSVVASYVLIVPLATMAVFVAGEHSGDVPAWQAAQAAVGICLGVVLLRLWYRAWATLPPARARASPRRAIGLLFVPVFNLYWVFQLSAGFAADHAAGGRDPHLPRGLFIAYPLYYVAVSVLSFTPLAATYAWPPVLIAGGVLAGLVTHHLCDVINVTAT
jgi:hypothetical protein